MSILYYVPHSCDNTTYVIIQIITLVHVYMKAQREVTNWQVQVIKRVSLHEL
jgi:uncharacterized protein YcnI